MSDLFKLLGSDNAIWALLVLALLALAFGLYRLGRVFSRVPKPPEDRRGG